MSFFCTLGMDHYFFIRGLQLLGLADNFFLKRNAFQTIFSLHFLMKTIFMNIFKNVTGFFYRSYLEKKNTSSACIHMKSLI